jgi:hypothetical protein
MAKLKIKQVKVYQSVKFEGAENSYFTPSQYLSIRTSKPEIIIEEVDNGCVMITSKLDKIKIGHANIAFIQYDISPEGNLPEEEKGLLKKAK